MARSRLSCHVLLQGVRAGLITPATFGVLMYQTYQKRDEFAPRKSEICFENECANTVQLISTFLLVLCLL